MKEFGRIFHKNPESQYPKYPYCIQTAYIFSSMGNEHK
jgi:hypothetical protein